MGRPPLHDSRTVMPRQIHEMLNSGEPSLVEFNLRPAKGVDGANNQSVVTGTAVEYADELPRSPHLIIRQ